jgi:hypothetical protein
MANMETVKICAACGKHCVPVQSFCPKCGNELHGITQISVDTGERHNEQSSDLGNREKSHLARIAIDYFLLFLDERNTAIDVDYKCKMLECFPEIFNELTPADQNALRAAAIDKLAWIRQGPDEYGYNPGILVDRDVIAFLESLSEGELFEQWCKK